MLEVLENPVLPEMAEDGNLDPEMAGFLSLYPHLEDYFKDRTPKHADHITGSEVTDCSDVDKPCIVGTIAGAIVKENQDIMTQGLKGCVAVYVEVPGYKGLAHFTPSSSLGYRHNNVPYSAEDAVKAAVNKITTPLKNKGSFKNAKAVIISNIAGENSTPKNNPWHFARVREDWDRLKSILEQQGFQTKIVEVPVDYSAVYSSPKNPGRLYVVGNKAHIDKVTGSLVVESGLADAWISTDPAIQEKFVEHGKFEAVRQEMPAKKETPASNDGEELRQVRRRLLEL